MSNVIEEYSYFKTPVGGVLAIPNKWQPSSFVYIDKNWWLNRDEDYILNTWADSGSADSTPYKVCQKLHPKEDIEICIAKAYDMWVDSLSNGGVRMFDAYDKEGNRNTYTSCWMAKDERGVLDFNQKYFAGYYPQVDGQSNCYGKPYQIEVDETPKEKKLGDFETEVKMKFQINLPLNK